MAVVVEQHHSSRRELFPEELERGSLRISAVQIDVEECDRTKTDRGQDVGNHPGNNPHALPLSEIVPDTFDIGHVRAVRQRVFGYLQASSRDLLKRVLRCNGPAKSV